MEENGSELLAAVRDDYFCEKHRQVLDRQVDASEQDVFAEVELFKARSEMEIGCYRQAGQRLKKLIGLVCIGSEIYPAICMWELINRLIYLRGISVAEARKSLRDLATLHGANRFCQALYPYFQSKIISFGMAVGLYPETSKNRAVFYLKKRAKFTKNRASSWSLTKSKGIL